MTRLDLRIIVIVALGAAVYANSLGNPFIFDDRSLIQENLQIREWSNLTSLFREHIEEDFRFYRPIQMLTYTVDYHLWGEDPGGYHVTNAIIHIAVALAVFFFVLVLSKDSFISFVSACFFVVHPVHTEAVTYISGRADPLAALFILLSLISYLHYLEKNSSRLYGLSLAAFALALFSKEYALVFPVLMLLYHGIFAKPLRWNVFIPFAVMTLAYLALRQWGHLAVENPIKTSLSDRLPGVFVAMAQYVRLLIMPLDLHMGYGQKLFEWGEPKVFLGMGTLLTGLVLAFRTRARNPLLAFSLLWFFVTLLPVLNIYPVNAYLAEHWLYLPSVGFFVLAALGLKRILASRSKVAAACLIVPVVSINSYLTYHQNSRWKDPEVFYKRIIQYDPTYADAYNNLGLYYDESGEMEKAREFYSQAIKKRPRHARAYNNLGVMLNKKGQFKEAIENFEKAIRINPKYANAHNNLAVVYHDMMALDKAKEHYAKALELRPHSADAHNNMATLLVDQDDFDGAMIQYRKALELNPGNAEANSNLGSLLTLGKKFEEAKVYFLRALEAKPDLLEARSNLARIYTVQNKSDEAAGHYLKILDLNPENFDALNGLGVIYARKKQYRKAEDYFLKAVAAEPEHAASRRNLDQVRQILGYKNPGETGE